MFVVQLHAVNHSKGPIEQFTNEDIILEFIFLSSRTIKLTKEYENVLENSGILR